MERSAGDLDERVRLAAFDFLAQQTRPTPDGVPSCAALITGFTFDGIRVPLIGPQGIFKSAILPEMPLSITAAPVEATTLAVEDGGYHPPAAGGLCSTPSGAMVRPSWGGLVWWRRGVPKSLPIERRKS